MKKVYKSSLLIIAMAAGAFHASAQRDNRLNEEHVVSVVVNESEATADEVEKAFRQNAPESPNDNAMPRFAIVGKNNKFYLGLGAQFLGEAVFDWGDKMPSAVLIVPSSIEPSAPGNRSDLRFGWQSSNIYMNIVALPNTEDQIGVFLKLNFFGRDNSVKVYHLYAKYRGLQVGYNTGLFTDGAAMPFTLDFEDAAGYPFLTMFNASWTQHFTKNLTGAIGIDAPTVSFTCSSTTEEVNQRIPTVPMYLQYGWGDGSHVRLSGMVRPLMYRDLTAAKNRVLTGGGVQLSGVTPVVGNLSAQFNAVYGKGIASYIQDDNGLGFDAVATTHSGEMKMPETMGLTGALTYQFSDKVSSNLVYSHVTNWFGSDARLAADTYRYGDYVAANVIWAINKFASVGLEYDYGHRMSTSGTSRHTNRLQCQMAVTF